jgi:hypothetical protein
VRRCNAFICITATLAIVTIQRWRSWRRHTNTSLSRDEAAQIIANLVLATAVASNAPGQAESVERR